MYMTPRQALWHSRRTGTSPPPVTLRRRTPRDCWARASITDVDSCRNRTSTLIRGNGSFIRLLVLPPARLLLRTCRRGPKGRMRRAENHRELIAHHRSTQGAQTAIDSIRPGFALENFVRGGKCVTLDDLLSPSPPRALPDGTNFDRCQTAWTWQLVAAQPGSSSNSMTEKLLIYGPWRGLTYDCPAFRQPVVRRRPGP